MNREASLNQLQDRVKWDLVVIGGGANGLGAALDASSRGYKTLLLEQQDFAQGTSSKSTKLIHGGVRYLRQGRFSFVRSALKERTYLLEKAPHLVHAQPFILPTNTHFNQLYYAFGLKLYDFLTGNHSMGSSRLVSIEELNSTLPGVDTSKFAGAVSFFDGQFDDSRLAVNLAQTIVEHGGTVLNYVQMIDFIKNNHQITGIKARDVETHQEYIIEAKAFINATGAFVDTVRKVDDPKVDSSVVYSQGAHIVLKRDIFPGNHALLIPETSDKRLMFIIPWHNRVLIGTTETPLTTPSLEPHAMHNEVEYLLEHCGKYLKQIPSKKDFCSTFAGVRTLIKPQGMLKKSAWLPREHQILVSPSHLITLAGGKWTTFRKMGEDAVDMACKVAALPLRPSESANLFIHGHTEDSRSNEWDFYGSDRPKVEALSLGQPELLTKFHPDLPCRPVDVIWAVKYEMARTVEDVLARRTRSLLLGAAECNTIAAKVASIMAIELKKDKAWEEEQIKNFQAFASTYH